MNKSDWMYYFLESWDKSASQDNEGNVPDRSGYKVGFVAAWDILFKEIDRMTEELETAKRTIRDLKILREADNAALKKSEDRYVGIVSDDYFLP